LAESAELPLRYDLGPDPYARFARPAPKAGEASDAAKASSSPAPTGAGEGSAPQ
jgi:hypothetical protein